MDANPLDRDGFVKVYRRVLGEVYGRIRRRKAADSMGTYTLLVLAADHRNGFVPGSKVQIARGLRIPRKTFAGHIDVLSEVGEVEVVRAVNQHQDNAGIRVVSYSEIVSGRRAAWRDTDNHAWRDRDRQVAKSAQADRDLPAEMSPEEVEDLRVDRIEALREALMGAFAMNPAQVTRTPKGWLTKAAKDIEAVGGVPCEVRFRFEAFEQRIGRKPAKPIDLANEWPRIDSDRARRARELRESTCRTYGDSEDIDGVVLSVINVHPDEQDIEVLTRFFEQEGETRGGTRER